MAALARVDEDGATTSSALDSGDAAPLLNGLRDPGRRAGRDSEPVREVGAGARQRGGNSVDVGIIVVFQPRREGIDLPVEGAARRGRQHQRQGNISDSRLGLLSFRFGGFFDGGFFEDDMCIRATESEGRDSTAPRLFARPPRTGIGKDRYRTIPIHCAGRLRDVEGLGHPIVPHRLDDLDDACYPGSRLGVTNVGLHGAEVHRTRSIVSLAISLVDSSSLDRVAEAGSGAMSLDQVDIGRLQPRILEGSSNDMRLSGTVGRCQSRTRAVLVDGGAADECQDAVTETLCISETLEHEDTDALAPACAVGILREGAAARRSRERAVEPIRFERRGGRHNHPARHQRAARLVAP